MMDKDENIVMGGKTVGGGNVHSEESVVRDEMTLTFAAIPSNEYFARVTAAAFATRMDPTMEELTDIKTAVSEAVTNCVIHAYPKASSEAPGRVVMEIAVYGNTFDVIVTDEGTGIEDVPKAMEPLYTSRPQEERAGMGFSFMEAFMDILEVNSVPGEGTTVHMVKYVCRMSRERLKDRVMV